MQKHAVRPPSCAQHKGRWREQQNGTNMKQVQGVDEFSCEACSTDICSPRQCLQTPPQRPTSSAVCFEDGYADPRVQLVLQRILKCARKPRIARRRAERETWPLGSPDPGKAPKDGELPAELAETALFHACRVVFIGSCIKSTCCIILPALPTGWCHGTLLRSGQLLNIRACSPVQAARRSTTTSLLVVIFPTFLLLAFSVAALSIVWADFVSMAAWLKWSIGRWILVN